MKTISLLLLVYILIIGGCSPCKRLQRKCPPQVITERVDSIIVKDSIIYRDRIVPVHIPGEIVYRDSIIPGIPPLINTIPITLENKYALSRAWIQNSRLKMELEQKDQVINFRLDSADKVAKHWEYRWRNEKQTQIVEMKYIPKIYKYSLIFSILAFVSGVVYLLYKWKL